jgi:hypothetical protein
LVDNPFPNVRIIINNHTIQCYHFKVLFNKVKIYYDKKNYIYSLKFKVVVFAISFHYYIFVGDHMFGFIHDFKIIKKKYYYYFKYLLKLLFKTF